MKLRARALGLTIGVLMGVGTFAATLISLQFGQGNTLRSLRGIFLGYNISILGALLGLIWGFVDGFILGALIAVLYNAFDKRLYKSGAGVS